MAEYTKRYNCLHAMCHSERFVKRLLNFYGLVGRWLLDLARADASDGGQVMFVSSSFLLFVLVVCSVRLVSISILLLFWF
eukprot:COSAG01_NODE_3133_length_6533_cov_117.587842_10_plen_80_part_00